MRSRAIIRPPAQIQEHKDPPNTIKVVVAVTRVDPRMTPFPLHSLVECSNHLETTPSLLTGRCANAKLRIGIRIKHGNQVTLYEHDHQARSQP
jgi:hypothetical protein